MGAFVFIVALAATITSVPTLAKLKNVEWLSNENFYLSPNEMTFHEALDECAFLDGRLASILTEEQDKQIEKLLREDSPTNPLVAWTSGRYDFADKTWAWEAVNRPVTFENWISEFPQPTADTCIGIAVVALPGSYGWLPASCGRESSLKFRFICQF
jgi:hypothetical protein